MKCIFVTGGVMSSLGKGIASSALAALLKERGISKITLMKFDPYINVDAGTMNPIQHGEVFVTADGAETDLDLGHYERFSGVQMTGKNNVTSGKIYADVIRKERKGEYLGETIQVIPHITDDIKKRITAVAKDMDVIIIEIGGTVGDIESLPFLEAIRQLRMELGEENTVFIHLTLVIHASISGETKTKPTQHSVKELRSIGIQPDVLLCRASRVVDKISRNKIALFTNVAPNAVISIPDVKNLYSIPFILYEQKVDELIINQLHLKPTCDELKLWKKVALFDSNDLQRSITDCPTINIAMVGKYSMADSYKSINEALHHTEIFHFLNDKNCYPKVKINFIDSETINYENVNEILKDQDAILVPGGFGNRGVEGMIESVKYAREKNVPYLGICFGMQIAVIEFTRNVLNWKDANSTEIDPLTKCPVVALLTELINTSGYKEFRDSKCEFGGTMRLGQHKCLLSGGSHMSDIYKSNEIFERYRHRYEVNLGMMKKISAAGMVVTGTSEKLNFVEVIEIPNHRWFVGCQFHPEFTSSPIKGHPLFLSFVEAAREFHLTKTKG